MNLKLDYECYGRKYIDLDFLRHDNRGDPPYSFVSVGLAFLLDALRYEFKKPLKKCGSITVMIHFAVFDGVGFSTLD